MNMKVLTKHVEQIGSAWEEYKKVNDRRLSEIERKGNADPLTTEHLSRINHTLDEYKSRVEGIETTMQRPFSGAEGFMNPDIREHKQAFCNYLRKGLDEELAFLEKKALSVSSDSDGGYLVTPQMSERIARTIFETSPMRKVAHVQTISSDSLEVIQDYDEATAGWTSETGSISETDSPELAKKLIAVHELFAQPKATQKLIDDSSVDIESWLSDKITDVFSRKENTAFITGDGIGKPRGILTYASGTNWGQIEQVNSGDDGDITPDSLVKLYYALKEDYAVNATFMMNRASVQQVRLLKETTTGQYLWNPGIAAGAPDTLLGVPVIQAADMPIPATGSLSVAVGDFSRAYQIVDRSGIRVLRDPYTEKPFVKFYTTKRVGGDVVNFEAIKLLKLSV